jgi:homoserine kinase type II
MEQVSRATFPVIHSTLDPAALADEVRRRYGLDVRRCRLIARGSNDFYRVDDVEGRHALRVSRAGYRSAQDVGYELGLLRWLAAAGLPVPTPRPQLDASPFFTLAAPEGERPVVLLSWIDGQPLGHDMSVAEGDAAGRLLGRLQLAARGFDPPYVKRIDTVARIERQLRFVDGVLHVGSESRSAFDRGLAAVRAFFAGPGPAALPTGPTHGDFQFANVMKCGDGSLWPVDFDDCGFDLLAKDLVTFEWRARLERLPQPVIDAFEAGYLAARPMSAAERAALPVLRIARDLYLLVSYCAYIDRIGPVAGFERESRLVELLLEDLRRAGLDG